MRFNSGGKFKIMQITDIQEIPDVSPDTIKLINAALEEEKPDLVVLTGDQIKGYGVLYKGEFEALSEKGDVLGVYVGHDHKNSYVGKVGNIDVGFTQSAGFNVYGNGKQRGVRCFVLDENDPRNYKTYTKTYEQLWQAQHADKRRDMARSPHDRGHGKANDSKGACRSCGSCRADSHRCQISLNRQLLFSS